MKGDSSLDLQQRVKDASFHNVVVTPMGGHKVFLHCLGTDDMLQVFNDAIDFFSMLFFYLHKCTLLDARYEWGRVDPCVWYSHSCMERIVFQIMCFRM